MRNSEGQQYARWSAGVAILLAVIVTGVYLRGAGFSIAIRWQAAQIEIEWERTAHPAYWVGLPSVDDPLNTFRPSAKVTLVALAIFEPSLAR
jgi:hypothetical protein